MIFALASATECGAQFATNLSFRFPVRVIDGQRIDLHYLFSRWHSHADAVTNSRWVHLAGSILNDSPSGWLVDGKTESASGLNFHQKVFVVNPPRAEKQTLETLAAQQSELKKQNAALKSKARSLEKGAGQQKPRYRRGAPPQNPSATTISQMETNVLNQESGIEDQLSQIDKALAAIPRASSPTGPVYHVDFFVFYTGQMRNRMPLLDFGIPTR